MGTQYTGENFEVEPGKAVFFGSEVNQNVKPGQWHCKGFPAADSFAAAFSSLYIHLDTEEMTQVDAEVKSLIAADRKAGNGDKLSMVVLFKTFALFLFVQGVLKPEHFEKAIELDGYIDVPGVKFGFRTTLTVRILSEEGEHDFMTADANGVMI